MQQKLEKIVADRHKDLITSKNEIYECEREAEELERQEAELLRALALTQEKENETFARLKTALVASGVPKTKRTATMEIRRRSQKPTMNAQQAGGTI